MYKHKVLQSRANYNTCVKVPTTAGSPFPRTIQTKVQHHTTQQHTKAEPPSLYDDLSVLHSTANNCSSTCSLFTIIHRCTNADRQMALIHTISESTMHRTETSPHTCDLTIPQTSTGKATQCSPFFLYWSSVYFLCRQHCRSPCDESITPTMCSHKLSQTRSNWASKLVDVFGPSAPTYTRLRLSRCRAGKLCRLHLLMRTPACC